MGCHGSQKEAGAIPLYSWTSVTICVLASIWSAEARVTNSPAGRSIGLYSDVATGFLLRSLVYSVTLSKFGASGAFEKSAAPESSVIGGRSVGKVLVHSGLGGSSHGTALSQGATIDDDTTTSRGYSVPSSNKAFGKAIDPDPPLKEIHCVSDLEGVGSLNETCVLNKSVNLPSSSLIRGTGSLILDTGVEIQCFYECTLVIQLGGVLKLKDATLLFASTIAVSAASVTVEPNAVISTTGFGGDPGPQTSGTPSGNAGAGGGHGGRGANCAPPNKRQQDVWGGDAYSWSTVAAPWKYGSKGSSYENNKEGRGGGRINVTVTGVLWVGGSIEADGGLGLSNHSEAPGDSGGGGSGGSIVIIAGKV